MKKEIIYTIALPNGKSRGASDYCEAEEVARVSQGRLYEEVSLGGGNWSKELIADYSSN
ncbi:MAG: hypothetical protein SVR08_11860 [Spirochaetota bacterium]|nr:hypothetical protein [Spirochaetota bacterium]